MVQDRARADLMELVLNPGQRTAIESLTKGWDFNYVLDGGPGTGKTVTTARAMCIKEARGEKCYYVAVQKMLAENMRCGYGFNAQSICAFTKQSSATQTETVPSEFLRAHPIPSTNAQTLFIDEWGFASMAEISRLIACMRVLSTGKTQIILVGDLSQLEAPCPEATPSIHHPIMRNRMRVLSLTDDTGRFSSSNFAKIICNLRETNTPISASTERELQAQSYMSAFIPGILAQTTILCVTHRQRRVYNLRQYIACKEESQKVCVIAAKNPKSMPIGPKPPPIFMVYGQKVRVTANYWASTTQKCEVIANGTTGTLVSGPVGPVTSSTKVSFIVNLDGVDHEMFCRELLGESNGWIHVPIDALGAATIAGAQGQTLNHVTVDAAGCNRKSLMVALSRGRKFYDGAGGVHLINYEPSSAGRYHTKATAVDVYAEKFRRLAAPALVA